MLATATKLIIPLPPTGGEGQGEGARLKAPAPAPAAALAALLLLLLPSTATALPGNRAVGIEGGLAGPRGGAPAVTLSAGAWLEWELEVLCRVTLGSAPRPDGREATAAVTPELGLRWAPDDGRWRPFLAATLGVRLPAAGRATTPTGALLSGLERRLGGGWAAVATLGVRAAASERAAGEAALGVRLDF
jgi:hypothetical protein